MPKELITLETVDVDGAIQETAQAAGATRADFLKQGGVAGAGFLAGSVLFGGLVSPAEAAISTKHRSKKNDVKILNYALTLEYLESEFYAAALNGGSLKMEPHVMTFASVVHAHEAAHVKLLKSVLGAKAVKKPKFDFGETVTNADKFRATAQVLEDTGVAAYAGQGPNILQRPVVKAALSIHSVEARHAAWIRYINSDGGLRGGTANSPAPHDTDAPKTEKTVLKTVKATGFIKG
jgi:hypothetical protein